jgi:hypothetical protein
MAWRWEQQDQERETLWSSQSEKIEEMVKNGWKISGEEIRSQGKVTNLYRKPHMARPGFCGAFQAPSPVREGVYID